MFDLLFTNPLSNQKFAYRIDPRAKLIILITFIIVLLLTSINYPLHLGILAIFLLVSLFFSDLLPNKLARLLSKIYPMILFISLFQLFTPTSNNQVYSGFSMDVNASNLLLVMEFQIHTLSVAC